MKDRERGREGERGMRNKKREILYKRKSDKRREIYKQNRKRERGKEGKRCTNRKERRREREKERKWE